ncbi:hypothetical protein LZ906_007920 [Paraclostridium ghonii]|uniref:hypothetical protein n=1 Tax=Paraclostridium ghonii TaxID=29358 RepID=UPI00202CB3E5|nr:hypothetical protein [Paeniclostridium ghonii]MCM0167682.1 hypothetical protein [Paeniclostridium ghonii]
MNLEQAIDYLAKNCPYVFAPIVEEMDRINVENKELKARLSTTQDAIDFMLLKGGI